MAMIKMDPNKWWRRKLAGMAMQAIISRQGTPKEVKERDALAGIAVDWANRVMRQILKHEKVEADVQMERQSQSRSQFPALTPCSRCGKPGIGSGWCSDCQKEYKMKEEGQ